MHMTYARQIVSKSPPHHFGSAVLRALHGERVQTRYPGRTVIRFGFIFGNAAQNSMPKTEKASSYLLGRVRFASWLRHSDRKMNPSFHLI